jgi:glutamine synthetase
MAAAELLQRALQEKGVKYCMASFVDMHGVSKAKFVPIDHLGHMLEGSELYTGAALEGVPQDVSEEEVAAHPDRESCTVLPWQTDVAWFASDLWCHGKPFDACSRNILGFQEERARKHGYVFKLGIEAEFYVLREVDGKIVPGADRDQLRLPCYDARGALDNLGWLGELVQAMQTLGWGVYSFDHEDGNGQFEIDFNYANGRVTADRYVFFRMMAGQIAARHGCFASFMPKPFADKTGSGAHFNISLADATTGRNLFDDPSDPQGCGLSALGYQFVAGVVRHLPAITAVVAPTVNSYKRLVKQGAMSQFTWAPVFACFGNNNRTNAVRIPRAGGRMELRAADSACNPYLGAALVLAAGLEGIEQGLDSGPPNRDNMYLKSPEELRRLGVGMLPRSLGEALEAFREDALAARVFGESMSGAWLAQKEREWLSFQNHVSEWERDRYLRMY